MVDPTKFPRTGKTRDAICFFFKVIMDESVGFLVSSTTALPAALVRMYSA
jgi:hypothetical protein